MRLALAHAAVAVALFGSAGCITHAIEQEFDADAPVELLPAARDLYGQKLDDICVSTDVTLRRQPLDSATVRDVATRANRAVVSIYAVMEQQYGVHLVPMRLPWTIFTTTVPQDIVGSGFIVHPKGYVLTNDHVVRNTRKLGGLMEDGTKLQLEVLARDPVYDLALLQIVGAKREFPVLPLGDSREVAPGDMAIAIGNPLGLGHTVTLGIVSQTGRQLVAVDEDGETEDGPNDRRVSYIQTDTAINPGSSGGPLITLAGACVGVNTAGIVQAQNIGFAVPTSQVRVFLDRVLRGEGVRIQR